MQNAVFVNIILYEGRGNHLLYRQCLLVAEFSYGMLSLFNLQMMLWSRMYNNTNLTSIILKFYVDVFLIPTIDLSIGVPKELRSSMLLWVVFVISSSKKIPTVFDILPKRK